MFPIKDWQKYKIGYKHGAKTFYSNFHLGIDLLTPEDTPVYAAFDGNASQTFGPQGGLQIHLAAQNKIFRHLHLNRVVKTGPVREGDLIAYTGGKKGHPNAGNSTAPHLHFDIFDGPMLDLNQTKKFLDPLKFNFEPMIITSKVSLYTKNLPAPERVTQGIAYLNQKINEVTGGQFRIATAVFQTTEHFDGQPIGDKVQVFPEQILRLPAHGAKVICLVHDGIHPVVTNPFHSPTTQNGATPIQIPSNWFVDGSLPGYQTFAEYYMHELLHAWYYLIGHLPHDEQIRRVHQPPPDWGGYGTPLGYYLSLLMELKPYWSQLGSPAAQGETMKIVLDGGTGFIVGTKIINGQPVTKKIGLADPGLYNALKEIEDVKEESTTGIPQVKVIEQIPPVSGFQIKNN